MTFANAWMRTQRFLSLVTWLWFEVKTTYGNISVVLAGGLSINLWPFEEDTYHLTLIQPNGKANQVIFVGNQNIQRQVMRVPFGIHYSLLSINLWFFEKDTQLRIGMWLIDLAINFSFMYSLNATAKVIQMRKNSSFYTDRRVWCYFVYHNWTTIRSSSR